MGDGEGEMRGSDVELTPNCPAGFLLGQKSHTAAFLEGKDTNCMEFIRFNFSNVTIVILENKS